MRKAVTLRLDNDLLEEARRCAIMENRTLTNFIETAVKQKIGAIAGQPAFIVPMSVAKPPPQEAPPLPDQTSSYSSEKNHD